MKNYEEFLFKTKLKIQLKDYESAITMLEKEIKQFFIEKINEIDKNYKYTNIIDLIDKSSKTLDNKYFVKLKKFYILINEDSFELYKLDCLINIYKELQEVS